MLRKTSPSITAEAALGPVKHEDEEDLRISAYARLDFDNFTFFVQTLQVVLGRKLNDELIQGSHHAVDVHLSSKKAISRRHAKIFYNFGTQRFELSILGRNGAFVDNSFVEKGITVPLTDGTKIQVGDITFAFVLPSLDPAHINDSKPSDPPLNPSDAINLRLNLLGGDGKKRRASMAARRKSLASASTDEINEILAALGAKSVDDIADDDDEFIDQQISAILSAHDEEDEIDKLVRQHNLLQGVDLDLDKDDSKVDPELRSAELDRDIASLAPLLDPSFRPARPLMGRPASIQPGAGARAQYAAPAKGYPAPYYAPRAAPAPLPPRLEVPVRTLAPPPAYTPLATAAAAVRAITVDRRRLDLAPVCVFRAAETGPTNTPKLPRRPPRESILRRTARPAHLGHDVPDQFKSKPNISVPAMVATVLKTRGDSTLVEIIGGIRQTYPYYQFCPDGWQVLVVHNVRLNKLFKRARRTGGPIDWAYALDAGYISDREKVKVKQQEVAAARARAAAAKTEELRQRQRMDAMRHQSYAYAPGATAGAGAGTGPRPKTIAELASEIRRDRIAGSKAPLYFMPGAQPPAQTGSIPLPAGSTSAAPGSAPVQTGSNPVQSTPSQSPTQLHTTPSVTPSKPTLASPASPTPLVPLSMNSDTKKSLAYLQKELFVLYKARKLSYNTATTTEIITKALATTIAQVNVIGAKAGCGDNALSFLVEKAPQQVSKILDIALTKSIKEKQGVLSKPSSRDSTPVPQTPAPQTAPAPAPPPFQRTDSPLSRPQYSGTGLSKPAFKGGLSKPPQFLLNKKPEEKRQLEEKDESPNKAIKIE